MDRLWDLLGLMFNSLKHEQVKGYNNYDKFDIHGSVHRSMNQ